jgi:hypothetical protein
MNQLNVCICLCLLTMSSYSAHCLSEGKRCVSPYLDGEKCCAGLSCKAVHGGYKCYSKDCLDISSPCKKDSNCCEGSCQEGPDQQFYCKPN